MNKEEIEIKDQIYENVHYRVHVVRVPDMFFDTYAVINRSTGVVEQIHPNQFNVVKIADQFSRWLTHGPDEVDEQNSLLESFGIDITGKAN